MTLMKVTSVTPLIVMTWTSRKDGREDGQCLAEPDNYDRTNKDVLEPFQINEETLIYLIAQTKQPPDLNIMLVKKNAEAEDDDNQGLEDDDNESLDIVPEANEADA